MSETHLMAEEKKEDKQLEEQHFKIISYFRKKMDTQPLHSALKSFNVHEAVCMSGVYEIRRENAVIYIGGNPHFSNIRDCLNAHFSGNDGLALGAWLNGAGKRHWKNVTVRWMPCANPHDVAYYLLEEYQRRHGHLPLFNNPPVNPAVPSKHQ